MTELTESTESFGASVPPYLFHLESPCHHQLLSHPYISGCTKRPQTPMGWPMVKRPPTHLSMISLLVPT